MRRLPLFACLAVLGCSREPPAAPPPLHLVARVNGAPITAPEIDLRLRGPGGAHGGGEADRAPQTRQAVLDALVAQELQAQRAVELGLDADPAVRETLAQIDAQARDLRRKELARALLAKEGGARATPTEPELRAWFEKHQARVKTSVRVSQILLKGEAAAALVEAELASGKGFDEVAAAHVPAVDGSKPWQLGFLAWQQVPEQWWPELDRLQPGQVSRRIAGPRERYWVLRLDERRETPEVSFEQVRPALEAVLRAERLAAAPEALTAELRARAKVELLSGP